MPVTLDRQELAGAWKALCAALLAQAVERKRVEENISSRHKQPVHWFRKEECRQRSQARCWLDGGVGVVTFEDCCEALDVEPSYIRKKIKGYCQERKRKPINSKVKAMP
jgi:hypothetical protein